MQGTKASFCLGSSNLLSNVAFDFPCPTCDNCLISLPFLPLPIMTLEKDCWSGWKILTSRCLPVILLLPPILFYPGVNQVKHFFKKNSSESPRELSHKQHFYLRCFSPCFPFSIDSKPGINHFSVCLGVFWHATVLLCQPCPKLVGATELKLLVECRVGI